MPSIPGSGQRLGVLQVAPQLLPILAVSAHASWLRWAVMRAGDGYEWLVNDGW